ncbi:MAG: diguanylate cyclase [Alphaproteobacteria bacterium]|nr:diguanylate cyclase [Alphaproteobacteria bacterium]
MKVGGTGRVGTPGGPANVAGPGQAYRSQAVQSAQAAAASAPRRIADVASIHGIPDAEFSPRVREAFMVLMAEVERLRDELRRSQARIEYLERLVDQDVLVPVNNRRAFVRELTRQIDFSERYGEPSTLIFIDLDGFKEINDTKGHAAGDAVLRHVAEQLNRNLRSSDYVGRLGGDEFGVILVQADERRGNEKADQLLHATQDTPMIWETEAISIQASIGVYTFRRGEDAVAALAAADAAMYAAMYAAKKAAKGEKQEP